EAMSAEAGERRLPGRKGEAPTGDRVARAPAWESAGPEAPRAAPAETRTVALLRAAPPGSPPGIDASCVTGLSTQNIQVTTATSVDDVRRLALPVVVLDVGSGLDGAEAQLQALRAAAPEARVLVCAAGLGAGQISGLVAAGAADALRYPIAPDALARKIDRVLRRGR
ncbi:MAG: serine/threonine protein kinase, partial [Minicystis sp.]